MTGLQARAMQMLNTRLNTQAQRMGRLSRNHAGDQRRSQGIPALQQRASVGPIRQRVNWGAQMRDRERTAGGGWMSVTKGNGGRLIKEGDEERRIQGQG
ncbi:Uncharacterized protein HZ326_1739 [Fusarium oxysporum f. sp. albedinis]|nr:Uncharacterized protein HZ326_1739 [Fusarium oxysporum f. sp. albedinis]